MKPYVDYLMPEKLVPFWIKHFPDAEYSPYNISGELNSDASFICSVRVSHEDLTALGIKFKQAKDRNGDEITGYWELVIIPDKVIVNESAVSSRSELICNPAETRYIEPPHGSISISGETGYFNNTELKKFIVNILLPSFSGCVGKPVICHNSEEGQVKSKFRTSDTICIFQGCRTYSDIVLNRSAISKNYKLCNESGTVIASDYPTIIQFTHTKNVKYFYINTPEGKKPLVCVEGNHVYFAWSYSYSGRDTNNIPAIKVILTELFTDIARYLLGKEGNYEADKNAFFRELNSNIFKANMSKRITGMRAEVSTLESKVESTLNTYRTQASEIKHKKKLLEILDQQDPIEEIKKQVQEIAKLPEVTEAIFDETGVVIIDTVNLYCNVPERKCHYDMGRFTITINLFADEVKRAIHWKNNTRMIEGHGSRKHAAPHIIDNGYACLGDAATEITKALAEYNLLALAYIAINFPQSANLDDGAGKYVGNWPKLENKDIVPYDKQKEKLLKVATTTSVNQQENVAILHEEDNDFDEDLEEAAVEVADTAF